MEKLIFAVYSDRHSNGALTDEERELMADLGLKIRTAISEELGKILVLGSSASNVAESAKIVSATLELDEPYLANDDLDPAKGGYDPNKVLGVIDQYRKGCAVMIIFTSTEYAAGLPIPIGVRENNTFLSNGKTISPGDMVLITLGKQLTLVHA